MMIGGNRRNLDLCGFVLWIIYCFGIKIYPAPPTSSNIISDTDKYPRPPLQWYSRESGHWTSWTRSTVANGSQRIVIEYTKRFLFKKKGTNASNACLRPPPCVRKKKHFLESIFKNFWQSIFFFHHLMPKVAKHLAKNGVRKGFKNKEGKGPSDLGPFQ